MSAALPASAAAACAFAGSVTLGKAYMLPCGALQLTPSSALRAATSFVARRLSELMMVSRLRAWYRHGICMA